MSESFNPFAAPQTMDQVQTGAVGDYEDLAGVERGLRLIYFGICGVFLSAMATVALALVDRSLVILGGIGVLVSWLMLIIGPFFCLSAPPESGAKGLIGASILFQLTGFLLSLGMRAGPWVHPAIQLVAQFSGVAGGILFIFFLMKIARFIGREDLRRKGITVILGSIVLFFIAAFSLYSLITGGRGNLEPASLLAIVVTVFGALVLFVTYANLINYLGKAISSLRSGSMANGAASQTQR